MEQHDKENLLLYSSFLFASHETRLCVVKKTMAENGVERHRLHFTSRDELLALAHVLSRGNIVRKLFFPSSIHQVIRGCFYEIDKARLGGRLRVKIHGSFRRSHNPDRPRHINGERLYSNTCAY